MALVLDDRVRETSSTTGTGTLNLGGAVGGFQTFVAGVGDGNTTYYAIVHRTEDEWELGVGTVTDATTDTLARTTVISSSNSDSAVSFSAGTKDVFVTQPASKAVYEDAGADVTLPDDLILGSDSAVLKFGADSDTTLTHTDGTGLTLNSTNKLTFQDTGTYIHSNADGDLDLVSDGTAVDSINLESAGGITLDAGTASNGIVYEDDGTEMMRIHNSSSDVIIESKVSDKDIIFKVNDGGSSTEVARIDGDVSALLMASGKELRFADSGEKISGNGTDLTLNSGADINLTATTDINVPANVGITFGDDAEKIEGDGTDLTITGNNINLTATADVVLAANTGLVLDGSGNEKIESDGTDISISVGSGGDINIPSDIGVTFGNDGEKIEGDGTDLTISGNNINLTATADVNIPSGVGLTFATAEKIESDGTDLSITVGSNGDVNLPANIGLTFGDDGEKIEGDGTDLTISGNNINLTATADVNIPSGVGVTFATAEKIESDGTDLTITVGSGGDINIPANIGMTFGDDGEKIEGDGTDLTISGNNINLTATADVVIPANVGVTFGSGEKIEGDSTDLTVTSGAKINLNATSDVHIPNDVGIVFGGASEKIEGDGTDLVISANNLTVDAAADIVLDAAGNNLTFKSGGTSILDIANNSSDVELTVSVADKNFAIKGTDGSSAITALDIDMAAAGKATFNGAVVVGGNLTVNGTTTTVNSTTMTVDDPIITLGGDSAPGSDDNKDRGVEFRYHDGSAARIGFMGFDDSATAFTFLTAASNSSEVFSGTAAKLVAGELDISGDVAVGDDLSLDSDAAVLNFGADSDVNLTHVADTGLLLNAAMVIQFRDSGLTIGSNADGDLDIVSDGTAVDSINIESAGGITLDAGTAGSGVIYEDDGTEMLRIHNSSSDVIVESKVSDKDIIFKVNDGGSSTEVARIDGDVSAFLMASGKELRFADSGEKISGDGTDLTLNSGADINLTATADINVPANVGITFGDDAEKIEGDGTDLTVTGNNIKLTATADVVVPANVGITFGTGEKIEGNNTDLTITSGADIALTATADVNVPANVGITFGDDGEKIEGDGTDLTIASSGVINLAAGGTTNQIKVTDGAILPITDDDVDLGSASYQFKNAFFDGTLEADAITIGGSAVTAGGASTADATALAIALG